MTSVSHWAIFHGGRSLTQCYVARCCELRHVNTISAMTVSQIIIFFWLGCFCHCFGQTEAKMVDIRPNRRSFGASLIFIIVVSRIWLTWDGFTWGKLEMWWAWYVNSSSMHLLIFFVLHFCTFLYDYIYVQKWFFDFLQCIYLLTCSSRHHSSKFWSYGFQC